jgi:hypothetical protein
LPETPDFEQIAHSIAMSVPMVTGEKFILHRTHIAEQLRQVWNARGAADLETIQTTLSTATGVTAAALYVENLVKSLVRAISQLDRWDR